MTDAAAAPAGGAAPLGDGMLEEVSELDVKRAELQRWERKVHNLNRRVDALGVRVKHARRKRACQFFCADARAVLTWIGKALCYLLVAIPTLVYVAYLLVRWTIVGLYQCAGTARKRCAACRGRAVDEAACPGPFSPPPSPGR